MGYRAHTITQHREYGSSMFLSWDGWVSYFDYLRENYDDEAYIMNWSENEDEYELDKEVLKMEIERVGKLKADDAFEFEMDLSNKDVAECLQRSLDEAPENDAYVMWEWF